MFLHVGNGETERKSSVIGIFDLDTASVSGITRDFLKKSEKNKTVVYKDSDIPRAFLLVEEKPLSRKFGEKEKSENFHIRLSHISAQGLYARMCAPIAEDDDA